MATVQSAHLLDVYESLDVRRTFTFRRNAVFEAKRWVMGLKLAYSLAAKVVTYTGFTLLVEAVLHGHLQLHLMRASVLRAETGDCSRSSTAYYFQSGCSRGAEKPPHIECWKPGCRHIRLATTHTVGMQPFHLILPVNIKETVR